MTFPSRESKAETALRSAGDEVIKLWEMNQHSLKEVAALESTCDAVLALASRDNTLFAGHQGGVIKVNLDFVSSPTRQLG